MENKLSKLIGLLATLFLLILVVAIGIWLYYSVYTEKEVAQQKSTPEIKINEEVLNKIGQPLDFGTPVSPDEPGYGRGNPFAPYKAPPPTPTATPDTATVTPGTG